MVNTFSDWLFNVMLWGAVVALVVLSFNAFVAPILGAVTAIVALVLVVVLSMFWPHY
jgi:hypothetical protein